MEREKRIQWVDYSKAIGIILVVIAHIISDKNYINIYAYSFHLPLFFILSGFISKSEEIENYSYGKVLKKEFKNILVPYYFYTGFIVAIELAKNILQHDADVKSSFIIIGRWIFLVGLKADWFLPCLFFAKMIFVVCYRNIKNRKMYWLVVAMLPVLVMTIPSKSFYFRTFIGGFTGSFFVAIGYYLKKKEIKLSAMQFTGITLLWILCTYFNGKVSMFLYEYGRNVLLFMINAVLGSVMIMSLSRYIESKNSNIGVLSWIGRNSLVIMIVHMEIIAILNIILTKIHFLKVNNAIYDTVLIIMTLILSFVSVPFMKAIYNRTVKREKENK
ncbi:MAG: acyltransferase family protein [Lachnospiraceae bacterium]|nr:acyltransferase family protein [Lachnospiraceae bacterium]